MTAIEVFVQVEGRRDSALVRVPAGGTVRDLAREASAQGRQLADGHGPLVLFLEESDEALDPDATLERAGVVHRSRVHAHRCRRVQVTVNYLDQRRQHPFSPATTVERVTRWADREFGLSGPDATDHVLQLCRSDDRPDEEAHVGTLTTAPTCTVCFDLVPKERIEG